MITQNDLKCYDNIGDNELILALYSENAYCSSNTYIPNWNITDYRYYKYNQHEFEDGYILISDLKVDQLSTELPKQEMHGKYSNLILAYKMECSKFPQYVTHWHVTTPIYYIKNAKQRS